MSCQTGAETPRLTTDMTTTTNTNTATNPPTVRPRVGRIKIAIDMHKKEYRVVRQLDHTMPEAGEVAEGNRRAHGALPGVAGDGGPGGGGPGAGGGGRDEKDAGP